MIYKFSHKGTRGCAYLLYDKGVLKTMHHDFTEMKHHVEQAFKNALPLHEVQAEMVPEPFKCKAIPAKTAREKVMLFCHFYKHKNPNNLKKATYTAAQKDFNNIQKYVVTESYLESYFAQKDYPFTTSKSITDYIRLYNEIRRIATNGPDMGITFPNEYDAGFERKLETNELSKYWQHLKALGFVKKQVGTKVKWEKASLFD